MIIFQLYAGYRSHFLRLLRRLFIDDTMNERSVEVHKKQF